MAAKFNAESATVVEINAEIARLQEEITALRTARNLKMADEAGTRSRMYSDDEVREMRAMKPTNSYKQIWLHFGSRGTPGLVHDICVFKAYRDVR